MPPTWALTCGAHTAYREDREGALSRLNDELSALPPSGLWAVRSSANVEDQAESSFAGQFASTLRVKGLEELVKAVEATWISSDAPRLTGYSQRSGAGGQEVRMGVLIQQMIEPVMSGVSFSRNPVSGRSEVVIEAINGSGEGLVQRGLEPLRPGESALPEALVVELQKSTRAIAARMGNEVDLEWVYDGNKVWWVQVRPITGERKVAIYSNRMAKEMLPGAIKPLVWSVNIPLINGAWIRIFQGLTGRRDLDPFKLSRSFHYRVYFNMGEVGKIWESLGLPSDSLEQLTLEGMGRGMSMRITPKTAASLPRVMWFGLTKLGWLGRTTRFVEEYEPRYRAMIADDLSKWEDTDLLRRYADLYTLNREAAYRNIITMLLTAMYTSVLKRMVERGGASLDTVEWNSMKDEQLRYYPASGLRTLADKYRSLSPAVRSSLDEKGLESIAGVEDAEPFVAEWRQFMERFGHLSDSGNDLTRAPWREQPYQLLNIVREYNGKESQIQGKGLSELEVSPMSRGMLKGIARRTSRYSMLKERMSSTYSLGYGLFRPLFLELGTRLRDRGFLAASEDVFYIYLEELRKALSGEGGSLKAVVDTRKNELAKVGDLPLPEVIYGEELPPLISPTAKVLKGLATSKGYYRGRARLVRGASDFDKVKEGDVIVIPYSDVSWSSIFSRASAVISESGGVLSHSSILAREYGIPSVVSVPHAMLVPDGAVVVVDGFKGHVYLDPGAGS